MALTLPGKELSMTDYCAFSKDHKCIKFTDYEITLHELDAYCEAKRPDLRSKTVAFRFLTAELLPVCVI